MPRPPLPSAPPGAHRPSPRPPAAPAVPPGPSLSALRPVRGLASEETDRPTRSPRSRPRCNRRASASRKLHSYAPHTSPVRWICVFLRQVFRCAWSRLSRCRFRPGTCDERETHMRGRLVIAAGALALALTPGVAWAGGDGVGQTSAAHSADAPGSHSAQASASHSADAPGSHRAEVPTAPSLLPANTPAPARECPDTNCQSAGWSRRSGCLPVAVALTHELEIYLPLTSQGTTAPTTPVLADLEVHRIP